MIDRWLKLALSLGAFLLLAATLATPSHAAAGYANLGSFASGPGTAAGELTVPRRLAVEDATGLVFVADHDNDRVQIFSPLVDTATYLTEFGVGVVDGPLGVAIDQSTGNVYVSDDDDVVKFTSDGAPLPTFTRDLTFTSPGVTGALAFDQAADRLIVADAAANRVRRYEPDGTPDGSFDGTGYDGGAFTALKDIAVADGGDLLVVDGERVVRTSAAGGYETTLPSAEAATSGTATPDLVTYDPHADQVVVGHSGAYFDVQLFRFADGQYVERFRPPGSSNEGALGGIGFGGPGIGRLYVATEVHPLFGLGSTTIQVYEAAAAPVVNAVDPLVIRPDRAVLGAQINAHGIATTFYVEYGPTASYGKRSPSTTSASAGSGRELVTRTRTVVGLDPSTEYHYRTVAESFSGRTYGADRTFRAAAPPPPSRDRVYEQVSPSDKNGYPVFFAKFGQTSPFPAVASRDGKTAIFDSWGSFGQAGGMYSSYRSVRTADGWVTRNLTPPAVNQSASQVGEYSATINRSNQQLSAFELLPTRDNFDPTDVNNERDIYVPTLDGKATLISRGNGDERLVGGSPNIARSVAVSENGQHFVFGAGERLVPESPQSPSSTFRLYDRSAGETRLVSVLPGGAPLPCDTGFDDQVDQMNRRHLISDDGSRIVFWGETRSFYPVPCPPEYAGHIFMRVDNERTIDVSASQRTVPDPAGPQLAEFLWASPDGSRVLFRSQEQLTDDALANGGLYEFSVDDGVLRYRHGGPTSGNLRRVLGASPDLSRIFYTESEATFQLVGDQRVAVGPEPTSEFYYGEADVTPDGRALLFVANQRYGAYDAGGKRVAYLYREGQGLQCLSCRPDGQPPLEDAALASGYGSSISDDGSRVLFLSADALLPTDINDGRRDVYEMHDGTLSLVSSGRATDDAAVVGISADGNDAFFTTPESLVPQDKDGGDLDIYDARIGGGFGTGERVTPPVCEGDACQGERQSQPGAQTAPESARTRKDDGAVTIRPRARLAPPSATVRSKLARTGQATVTVTANVAGTASLIGRGVVGKGRPIVTRATHRFTKAGTAHVVVRLSAAARRQLRQKRRLTLTLTLSFSGQRASQTVRVNLTKKGR